MKKDLTRYEAIRAKLDTGDIVLFSGKGWISWLIKLICRSKWSHVGMVVRMGLFDQVMLYESTTLSKLSRKKGVQLVSLRDRILTYKGKIIVRHLRGRRTVRMRWTLKDIMAEHRNKPYEKNFWQLFKAAYDGWFGKNRPDMSSVFCSELIATVYKAWGFLRHGAPANEYTPSDFEIGGLMDTGLIYADQPYCLSGHIEI